MAALGSLGLCGAVGCFDRGVAVLYTVTLRKNGDGAVVSTPAGIACDRSCGTAQARFGAGSAVRLEAIPAVPGGFLGWTGACSGTGACVLRLSGDVEVGAHFVTGTPTLTVRRGGAGSGTVTSDPPGIACGSRCAASFPRGTEVRLTAEAEPGATFAGWSGPCSGTGECLLVLEAPLTVSASFEKQRHLLSVSRDGPGTVISVPDGVRCGGACSAVFEHGSVVTLVAVPEPGGRFLGWLGDCAGVDSCTLLMDAPRSVSAVFLKPTYTVRVEREGPGTVWSSPFGVFCGPACAGSFPAGTIVTLSAEPDQGSIFLGWSGDCSGTDPCALTVDGAKAVTATFSHRLDVDRRGFGTVTSRPDGISCGTVCTAHFRPGTQVTLAASPTGEASFTGWTGDCTGAGDCALSMDRHRSVGASFAVCGGAAGVAAYSCKHLRANFGATGSGRYWVTLGGDKPFETFCDMREDGGGWTLIAMNRSDASMTWSQWLSGSRDLDALVDPSSPRRAWVGLRDLDGLGLGPVVVRQVNDSGRKGFWTLARRAPVSERIRSLDCKDGDFADVAYRSRQLDGPAADALERGTCGAGWVLGTNRSSWPDGRLRETTFFGAPPPLTGAAEDAVSGSHEWGHDATLWIREERVATRAGGCSLARDLEPPRVVSTSPPAAPAVDVSVRPTIAFSETMEAGSVEQAFAIAPAVPGAFAWDAAATLLRFLPEQPLPYGTEFTVTVGTTARDLAGNALAAPATFRFTTIGEPPGNSAVRPDASCARLAPGSPSGIYWLKPPLAEAPFQAFCDTVTDGGGWMLLAAYQHPGGTNRPLDPTTLPLDPEGGYSHRYLAGLGFDPSGVAEVRFYCRTSRHDRVIHFKTGNAPQRETAVSGASTASPVDWRAGFTTLPGHTANLPAATDEAVAGSGGFTSFPFASSFSHYWNIRAEGNRWECDDAGTGPEATTLHQVWVRADVTAPALACSSPPAGATVADVPVEAPVLIGFTKPMHRRSVENALRVEPAVAWTAQWNARGDGLVLLPAEGFAPSTVYSVTVSTAAVDLAGNALSQEIALAFGTRPGASANGPDNPALSCRDLLARGLGTTSGVYWIRRSCGVPPLRAYCDQTTDGGGWMLVLAYAHAAGTNPPLDETTLPLDPRAGLSHRYGESIGFDSASVGEARFFCETSAHARRIHFKTANAAVVSAAVSGVNRTSVAHWLSDYLPLPGHSAFLPALADSTLRGPGALTNYPFFRAGNYHWSVRGNAFNWECDDIASTGRTTLHQVWLR